MVIGEGGMKALTGSAGRFSSVRDRKPKSRWPHWHVHFLLLTPQEGGLRWFLSAAQWNPQSSLSSLSVVTVWLGLFGLPSGTQDDDRSSEGCTWATKTETGKVQACLCSPGRVCKALEAPLSVTSQISFVRTQYRPEQLHWSLARMDLG